jgi:glutamate-5-semialdehyde dehydrogenase
MRRVGICGAAETILLHKDIVKTIGRDIITALIEAGCEVRGTTEISALHKGVKLASDADWGCEFLAPIIAIKPVASLEEATSHIQKFGSGHTESILSEDKTEQETFFASVDSAVVMANASTQFADGSEFGMGAEIGIATGRLHARGPVGANQLTSFKYIVRGHGQTRP